MIGLMCIRDLDGAVSEDEINEFAKDFYQNYGVRATICYVHPNCIEDDFVTRTGVQVERSKEIAYPSYIHLGILEFDENLKKVKENGV